MTARSFALTREHEARLDLELSQLLCFAAPRELKLSPLLPRDFVLADHYVSSFPQHALLVGNELKGAEQYLLSPTCCYPVFHHIASTAVSVPTLLTHKNLCFRCEVRYQSGERQNAFLMREYILLAEDLEYVQAWIARVKIEVLGMLEALGAVGTVEKASDPFFKPGSLQQKLQASEDLKSEFVVDGLALGSVNFHLKSFSRSCNITSPQGGFIYSACFGLGYDRTAAKAKVFG